MGDQCLYRTDGGSEAADLIEQVSGSEADCGMVAVPVPEELVSNYGIIEQDEQGNFVKIWEKPTRVDAPSNLNNASIYLFNKAMFDYIERDMQETRVNEHEITDPINAYVADGHKLTVKEAKGKYLDCGKVEGWVAANSWLLEQTT
jgi:UTP-glucose-1-phosphate uridylyltransferase